LGAGGTAGCEAERDPDAPPHGNRLQVHHRRIDPQGIRTQRCPTQNVFEVGLLELTPPQIRQLIHYF